MPTAALNKETANSNKIGMHTKVENALSELSSTNLDASVTQAGPVEQVFDRKILIQRVKVSKAQALS